MTPTSHAGTQGCHQLDGGVEVDLLMKPPEVHVMGLDWGGVVDSGVVDEHRPGTIPMDFAPRSNHVGVLQVQFCPRRSDYVIPFFGKACCYGGPDPAGGTRHQGEAYHGEDFPRALMPFWYLASIMVIRFSSSWWMAP